MQSSINFLKFPGAIALSAILLACPEVTTNSEESDTYTALATIAALGQLTINGSYDYYNGTTSYTDTCGGFCSNGDIKVGAYTFANTFFIQQCSNTTDCGSPLPDAYVAQIVEYNNSKQILYAQFDENHPWTPNKYTYIQWMVVNGVTYTCPDISNVGSQDTLAKAKDFNGDGVEDYTAANDTSNINNGCGGSIFWSRLQVQ